MDELLKHLACIEKWSPTELIETELLERGIMYTSRHALSRALAECGMRMRRKSTGKEWLHPDAQLDAQRADIEYKLAFHRACSEVCEKMLKEDARKIWLGDFQDAVQSQHPEYKNAGEIRQWLSRWARRQNPIWADDLIDRTRGTERRYTNGYRSTAPIHEEDNSPEN